MKISFTVNIVEVFDVNGEPVPTEDIHYRMFLELFRQEFSDVIHELVDEGRIINYEMEDIDEAAL